MSKMEGEVRSVKRVLPTNTSKRLTNLQSLKARRKLWLQVHLWLGLSLGLFLALIGLTGAVLVFSHEIDQALNPKLYQTSTPFGTTKTLDEIIATAKKAAPSGWGSVSFELPDQSNGNYVFSFYYPTLSPAPEQAKSITMGIDPFTAGLTDTRVFYHGSNPLKHSFTGFLFKLHYSLLLGETGSVFIGILAVLFLISALSGLILCWPLTGRWQRVLLIKRHSSVERFNHDLHQTAGFYSLIVLLALLISGLYFNLPAQFSWLVERFSPLTPEPQLQISSGITPVKLETALKEARKAYPGGIPHYFALNNDALGVFTACYKDVPELQRYVVADRCLVLNKVTGELVQVKDATHGSAGDLFMQWQWPLHSGKAFGWTGRILVFITGLICPLLFVTGVIRWLQKQRAKQL